MIGIRLGVDYGTCTTAAVLEWPDRRRQPLPPRPSAVYAAPDGRLLAGAEALRAAETDPAAFEPNPRRRLDEPEIPLGPRAWRPAELIAATLADVAAEAYRLSGGAPVEQLVMVHPIGWGTARREVLAAAAVAAGLPAPLLIPEPVAAATAYAATRPEGLPPGRALVVYHLGAGTFEACVLRGGTAIGTAGGTAGGMAGPQPLAHQGLTGAAGLDLDAALLEHLASRGSAESPDGTESPDSTGSTDGTDGTGGAESAGGAGSAEGARDGEAWRRVREPVGAEDRLAVLRFRDDLRAAREALSREPAAAVRIPIVDRDVRITREELDEAVGPVLRRTVEATRAAIDEAHVQPADVDAVLLTGGASRTPLVAGLLQQATGIVPVSLETPESVAAHGALDAVPAGPVPAIPGVPGVPGAAGRRPRWLVPVIAGAAALVVLAVAAVVGGIWLLGRATSPDTVALPAGGGALLETASAEVVAATSYDYRDLDRSTRAAHAGMTDRMRKAYDDSMTSLRDKVVRQQATVSAQASGAGLVSATTDRATVMVYLNQYRTGTTVTGQKIDQNVVQAALVRQHGRWLLDQVEAQTTTLAGPKDATWPGAKVTAMLHDARSCVTSFMSNDYHRPDGSSTAVERCSTGTFSQQFRQDEAQVRQAVATNHVTSRVGGTGAAVVTAGATRATVLVSVDTTVRNDQNPTGRVSHYRCQLTVTRSGDRWLVSELRFVP